MGDLNKAITLAAKMHAGQLDKSGHPFIGHPLRVMARLAPDEMAMIAGVLHDVVEDTPVTLADLRFEYPYPAYLAIDAMTRRNKNLADGEIAETYFDYIDRVKAAGPIAIAVKLADLRDNMDPDRQWKDLEALKKGRYLKAWRILTGHDYDPVVDGR